MFREEAVDMNGAIDQLRANEIAAQQIREIEQGHTEESIQFAKKEKPKSSRGGTSKIKCVFCLQVHEFGRDNCPAYGSTCRACHQKNHWEGSKKCRKSKGQKMMQFVNKQYTSDDTCLAIEHTIVNVKSIGKTPTVDLQFKEQKDSNAKPLRCLIDTATTCNIMSIDDLNKLVPNAELRQSNTKLNFYDGYEASGCL